MDAPWVREHPRVTEAVRVGRLIGPALTGPVGDGEGLVAAVLGPFLCQATLCYKHIMSSYSAKLVWPKARRFSVVYRASHYYAGA